MIAERSLDPTAQLVLVSIGNTRTALATWNGETRSDARHVDTGSFDQLMSSVESLWDELPGGVPRAVVISSVCPPVLAKLRSACENAGVEPLLAVGSELPLPMVVDLPAPEKVGTDRLCAAAAAFDRIKAACVVADFGTAVTIDLVADNGVFLGGTILPGVALSARALHEHTAQLPRVDVGAPTEILGKDTESAIRNGVFAMMIGALREITERYATKIGKWPTLVVTGGDAEPIARAADFVDRVAPDLYLDGLVLSYRGHAVQNEPQA